MSIGRLLIKWGGCLVLSLGAAAGVCADQPRVEPAYEAAVINEKTSASGLRLPQAAMPGLEALFFVKEVRVEGPVLLSQDVLAPLVEAFEGRIQTIETMQHLAEAITAEYRKRGYLSSQAYIPPQEVKNGIFSISVIEGRIGRIMFEGNKQYSSALLQRYCDLREGEVFSYQKLQKTVVRLNANTDRIVRAIIRPGNLSGESDIVFKVEEKGLTHGNIFADNQGSKPIGQNRIGLGLRQDNLLKQDDVLRVGTMAGKDFASVFGEHALPLARIDSVWKTGVSFAKSLPKKQYKPYGVSSASMNYWGRLESRLMSDERLMLDWKTGMDLKESRTLFLSGTHSRERLRVLRFGPALTLKDSLGGTMIENQFSLGLDGLGAAIYSASPRAGVSPEFFASDFTISRLQKMPLNTRMSLRGKIHLSPDKQPSSEQMSLGGADTVRGYPEGDYFADQGALMNVEYLVPFFFMPDTWRMPWTQNRMRDSLEMAFFWDEGYGRFRNPGAGQAGKGHLSGTGIGLRARLSEVMYWTTDFAYATGDQPNANDERFRIHAGMQASF